MIDVETYVTALKVTWVKREIMGDHDWCELFRQEIVQGQFIWERNAASLIQMARKIYNPFWAEVLTAMAKYDSSVSTDIHDISRHSVWFSNYTKFQTREVRSWKRKGIVYINDLLKDNGELLSFEEAKIIYKLNGTSLDYLGLLQSLPIEWRNEQSRRKEVNPIIHPNVESILMHKQCNKSIYNILLRKTYRGEKNTWELCWEHELGQIDWIEVYELNQKSISSVYRTLQYKILTKITATNQLLYQIGRKSSYTCDRCETSIDTVTHKFWACPVVKRFWELVEIWLRNKNIIQGISGSVLNKKADNLGH